MVIGSQAAKYHFPDFYRPCKDIDKISEIKERGSDNHFCSSFQYILDSNPNLEYATPEILYTLKLSHCFWNIHWNKTMRDILFFQQKRIKHDEELFQKLYLDWNNIHGSKKKVKLKKRNEEFFKDNVDRIYIHDDLHYAVAYYKEPLYQKIKSDKSSAATSQILFEQLSFEDKIKLCREESYVTALERILIPSEFTKSRKFAYIEAIKCLLTSMTSGWFPKFIALHWYLLYDLDDHDFVALFKTALIENKIKKSK